MACSIACTPCGCPYLGNALFTIKRPADYRLCRRCRRKEYQKAFAYSAVFSLGTAVTFVMLGVIATSAGKLIGTSSSVWYIILGVLMVLMALQTWEVFNFIPSVNLISKSKKRGFIGAFLAGVLGGIFFLALLYASFDCVACHRRRRRQLDLGHSAYVALFYRTQRPCYGRGHFDRLCSENQR